MKTSIIKTPTKTNSIFVKKVLGRPVPIGRVGLPETQDFFLGLSCKHLLSSVVETGWPETPHCVWKTCCVPPIQHTPEINRCIISNYGNTFQNNYYSWKSHWNLRSCFKQTRSNVKLCIHVATLPGRFWEGILLLENQNYLSCHAQRSAASKM